MSETTPDTTYLRERLTEVLLDEGAGPGSSIHSWRCEHPDRYGPCDCVGEVADALLPVVAQEIAAAEQRGYFAAMHLMHDAYPDHCGGECFRYSTALAALAEPAPEERP